MNVQLFKIRISRLRALLAAGLTAVLLALSAAAASTVYGQDADLRERFPATSDLLAEFERIGQIGDESMRTAALNELWRQLRTGGHIPYTDRETALMLYRCGNAGGSGAGQAWQGRPAGQAWQTGQTGQSGPGNGADRVDWRGDFNRWGNTNAARIREAEPGDEAESGAGAGDKDEAGAAGKAETGHEAVQMEAGVSEPGVETPGGDPIEASEPVDANSGEGILIPGTDVWYTLLSLPCDARVDYKIVTGGSNWMLDPMNPALQVGGAGPNSVLAMPCYELPAETQLRYDINRGMLSQAYMFYSQALGYQLVFYVYFPHGYHENGAYPVVYVTDGHEYADEAMGGMVNILDNAIADSLIPPVMAVFIDARNPYSGENRRMEELVMNPSYASFLAGELVPAFEEMFAASSYDGDRAIMGTSLGGLNAAFVALNYPRVFGRAVLHSPAFWPRPEILDLYRTSRRLPVSYYISAGTIHDGLELATEFRDILHYEAFHMRFVTVNEGHSWGQWRGQILPALQFFWGRE